jgi:hypothetical protein
MRISFLTGTAVFFAALLGGCAPSAGPSSGKSPAVAESPPPDWSQAPATPEERLCAQFMRLKNNGDPGALTLLGPPTALPKGPVSQQEADRLDAEYFLRQDIHFTGVGRATRAGELVLCANGSVSAPERQVRTANGVESHQRVLFNPDVTVEVRDGRIYGVSAGAHLGP